MTGRPAAAYSWGGGRPASITNLLGVFGMAGLKTYAVEVNGFTTSVRLSDADAKARGLTAAADKPAAKPAGKSAAKPAAKEAAAPLNKSRAAASDK